MVAAEARRMDRLFGHAGPRRPAVDRAAAVDSEDREDDHVDPCRRSALGVLGQGNAVLAAPGLELREQQVCVLNPWGFRRAQARWLRLGLAARIAWGKEGRVCQVVRISDGRRTFLVANLHATSYPPDERLADAELLRAFVYVDGLAEPREGIAVAGDFNVTFARSRTLLDVSGDEWRFSRPGQGIDHVLVRNLRIAEGPTRWPVERRARGFATLSDHTPVDVVVE